VRNVSLLPWGSEWCFREGESCLVYTVGSTPATKNEDAWRAIIGRLLIFVMRDGDRSGRAHHVRGSTDQVLKFRGHGDGVKSRARLLCVVIGRRKAFMWNRPISWALVLLLFFKLVGRSTFFFVLLPKSDTSHRAKSRSLVIGLTRLCGINQT
jgi:hypothetical protein